MDIDGYMVAIGLDSNRWRRHLVAEGVIDAAGDTARRLWQQLSRADLVIDTRLSTYSLCLLQQFCGVLKRKKGQYQVNNVSPCRPGMFSIFNSFDLFVLLFAFYCYDYDDDGVGRI